MQKLIHIATIWQQNVDIQYLLLRQIEPFVFRWYQIVSDHVEVETTI